MSKHAHLSYVSHQSKQLILQSSSLEHCRDGTIQTKTVTGTNGGNNDDGNDHDDDDHDDDDDDDDVNSMYLLDLTKRISERVRRPAVCLKSEQSDGFSTRL